MAQVSGIEVRYTADTSDLERGTTRAEGALNTFKRAANDAVPSNFGIRIQNVGHQVQDFAVQVASGTSATRAFAQQAPQLLSGFGALGVVLGTVAAVAIPLAGLFIDAGKAAEGLGVALQTVGPYAATATAAIAGFYAPSILAGIATTTSAIGVGLVGAIKAVTVAMMANPLGLLVAGVATAAVALFAFRDDIKSIFGVDMPRILKDSVNFAIRGFMNLKDVVKITFENLGNIVGAALIGISNSVLRTITALSNKVIDGLNSVVELANKIPGVTIGAFQKLQGYEFPNVFADGAAKAGQEIGRAMAENAATDYVGKMGELASGAMSRVAEVFSGMGGGDTADSKDKKKDKGDGMRQPGIPGAGETDAFFIERLKAIQEGFKTEQEVLAEEYAANQAVLQGALDNQLLSEEEYKNLSIQLAQEHADALAAIQQTRMDNDLAAASSFFGSMAQAAQSGGKRLLKVAKAAAAAQAIVDTIRAAVSAMNDPTAITPLQKFANYAAVFAKGMAAVAAIKGVSEGGGGGGGGSGGGGGGRGAGAGASAGGGGGGGPTTTFQFTLMNDPMGFGEKFARQFIDQLNSTQRNGGQIRGVIA